MRIISGLAKGRRLFAPKSVKIRPVADKVKGAIFNILGGMEDAHVLDLFAGTGSVGLEAVSRGSQFTVFVDYLPEALHLLQKNIELCSFEKGTQIIRAKIPQGLKYIPTSLLPFQFVFVDPPYDRNLIAPALDGLIRYKLIDASSRIIIEHSPREKSAHPAYKVEDIRKYGQTYITFLNLNDS